MCSRMRPTILFDTGSAAGGTIALTTVIAVLLSASHKS
ncbi:Uncharacterised protein [Mycobacterium tuberculosis]|nr:Uncharacterised protein [Mycobacterium tuberculosis]